MRSLAIALLVPQISSYETARSLDRCAWIRPAQTAEEDASRRLRVRASRRNGGGARPAAVAVGRRAPSERQPVGQQSREPRADIARSARRSPQQRRAQAEAWRRAEKPIALDTTPFANYGAESEPTTRRGHAARVAKTAVGRESPHVCPHVWNLNAETPSGEGWRNWRSIQTLLEAPQARFELATLRLTVASGRAATRKVTRRSADMPLVRGRYGCACVRLSSPESPRSSPRERGAGSGAGAGR